MRNTAGMLAATVLGCGLIAAQGQAHAAEPLPAASGSVGAVDMIVDGQRVHAEPIAPCTAGEVPAAESSGVDIGTETSYGNGETRCDYRQDGAATALASGTRFETSVLERFGGPTIRVRTFSAQCRTTGSGSAAHIELGGVSGIPVPASIPPNHTIAIPGETPADPPIAEVVLNELIAPSPPDGSLTTHTMRITLFPDGGPASGDILLGTADCDPYGNP